MTMQNDNPSSDASVLLFPAFLYGEKSPCRRKMKAEAKKWAKRYREHGDFPEPRLAPVAPGSIVSTDESSANLVGMGLMPTTSLTHWDFSNTDEKRHFQWRLYLIHILQSEASWILKHNREEYETFLAAYEAFACRYPWGALSVAVNHAMFNTIEAVSHRIEGVLRFWEKLDTVRYYDHYLHPVSLVELMAFHFEGHVAMWVDQPTGHIRTDLGTAIDQMRKASQDEIRTRLIKRLRAHADVKTYLEHREWLKSPGIIEAEFVVYENKGRGWYEDLTTGYYGALGGFLFHLDKKYPGT